MADTRPTDRPTVKHEPPRRLVLALALLADVEPRRARRVLIHGLGSVRGPDADRLAIALASMAGAYR